MERRRMGTKRLRALATMPNIVLCSMLALFWMFLWVTFQSPTNLPLAPFEGVPAVPARFVSLLAMALGGVGLLVRARRRARKSGRSARVVLYGTCVAATVLLAVLDVADGAYDGDFAGVPFFAAFVLWGLLGALVYTEFGKLFSALGAARFRFCVACCIVSVVCSLPLHLAAWYLHGEFRETMVLLFLASFCPMIDYLRRAFVLKDCAPDRETRVPVKFVLTLLVLGLALGMMQGLFTAFTAAIPERSDLNPLSSLGFIVASVLCLITVFVARMDFNRLIYQVGFPFMALGFLVVAVGGSSFFGYLFSLAGYQFTELCLWILCIYLAVQIRGVGRWVFALLCCVTSFAQAVGLGVADGGGVVGFQREVCVVAGATLLAFSLYSVTSKNPYESWGIMRPGESDETNVLEQACELVAVEEFFTPREKDVFLLLAQGHNRLAVSQRLVVSENTVKTHMSNIYQKLGVHTQQELIDVVEARCKELREREARLEF
ncbi:response regulator transcription factor [Gordonibacter sp. An230]|uniref:response regulator transcription factor n=1 Tax=Gordonibacter sp. An230 TaxID=1965592 RepID=UPI0013A61F00|nr:helix-turn-helix transcriptional regulator [Gordonibacter sp. An230]